MNTSNIVIGGILLLVGLIHILPIAGVMGQQQLQSLYGLNQISQTTELLLRHRAILFFMLGVSLITIAFYPSWHLAGLLVALLATSSFIFLSYGVDGLSPEVKRVVLIDKLCVALVVIALVIKGVIEPIHR